VDAHGHLDGAGDAAAAVRIELVSSTGGPARQPLRPAPSSAETGVERPARAGAFAH
jgi:hypothetical protein